jgi:hypothetical protein
MRPRKNFSQLLDLFVTTILSAAAAAVVARNMELASDSKAGFAASDSSTKL